MPSGGKVDVASTQMSVSSADVHLSATNGLDVDAEQINLMALNNLEAVAAGGDASVMAQNINVDALTQLEVVTLEGVSLTTQDVILRADGAAEAVGGGRGCM